MLNKIIFHIHNYLSNFTKNQVTVTKKKDLNFLEKKSENPKLVLERSEGKRNMQENNVKHKKMYVIKYKWMQLTSKPLLPEIILQKLGNFS